MECLCHAKALSHGSWHPEVEGSVMRVEVEKHLPHLFLPQRHQAGLHTKIMSQLNTAGGERGS